MALCHIIGSQCGRKSQCLPSPEQPAGQSCFSPTSHVCLSTTLSIITYFGKKGLHNLSPFIHYLWHCLTPIHSIHKDIFYNFIVNRRLSLLKNANLNKRHKSSRPLHKITRHSINSMNFYFIISETLTLSLVFTFLHTISPDIFHTNCSCLKVRWIQCCVWSLMFLETLLHFSLTTYSQNIEQSLRFTFVL